MTAMQRFRVQGACALLAAGLVTACTEQAFQLGFQQDISPPTVAIVVPANDTINVQNGMSFTVDATDNLGLKSITVTMTAGLTAHDTTFTSTVTSVGWLVVVPQAETATLGGPILITATAVDGNNNATTDTVTVIATNPKALIVTLVRPTAGAVTAPGKQLLVQVDASQVDGLQLVGWRTIPGAAAVSATDTLYTPGLPADTSIQDTLTIPATVAAGTFSIVGFAKDASDRIVTTSPVVVTVQLVVTDTTGPVVTFSVPQRAEVNDSISVRARDPSGISAIGWLAFNTAGTQIGSGSNTSVGGTLTDVTQTWSMALALTGGQLPAKVILKAWATDANGNTDSARVDTLNLGSAVLADTITVINGVTVALPAGGSVADAIYNPNRNEVYLTNVALDRVEVFSVTDTSFKTAIPVGSRPWGIALWPRDTLTGANADTVVVANSGGTNLSVVNVAAGAEVRRVPLPLFDVQTVHSEIDPASGSVNKTYKQYFFSDRPEYVGMVCGGQTCKPGGTGDVFAVYST
ncbi:MAG: YncE family protein, partial [Micromonosporaceae bacterium]